MSLVILDYGMGNLRSVQKAVEFLGYEALIQHDLRGATKVILPGVGAFGAAMERLSSNKKELQSFARSGQPLMGICLGQQLLFERSDEFGPSTGLEILGGNVRYLPKLPDLKVPHMGWNELKKSKKSELHRDTAPGDQAYFVHSLVVEPNDLDIIASTSSHGVEFVASIQSGNVWGTQFHPEKSGDVGLKMLKNFLLC